jgi:nitrous oxide reductase accessory protein NosL
MRIAVLSVLLLVAACRKEEPPAPTPEQSAQLNEADQMLNNLSNEEGPEANASGPSNSSD